MSKVLLSLHVVAAILLIGPVTVAASLFPRYARQVLAAPDAAAAATAAAAVAVLHRVSRVYGYLAAVVPALGLATALSMGVGSDPWVAGSIVLTGIAAFLLAAVILPAQSAAMSTAWARTGSDTTGDTARHAQLKRLAVFTGIFATLWVIVVILMIVRPGSTTGA
ncbi:MAG: DUF2269 family protein [Solirubrobacteraceae bacterium]|nr:DUF2269 family protein [Solirubrobacteraceae bacterium]